MRGRSKHRPNFSVTERPTSVGQTIDPIDYLLAQMNDNTLPPRLRAAIAKKLLPFLHQKLKPLCSDELYDDTADVEAGSETDDRDHLRKLLFGFFN